MRYFLPAARRLPVFYLMFLPTFFEPSDYVRTPTFFLLIRDAALLLIKTLVYALASQQRC